MSASTTNGFEAVRQAALLIRDSKRAIVFTGAGFSTPSGIPDFRSAGSGLWTRYLPMEVASLSTFRYDPEKFFGWLRPLASHMLSAEPSLAHLELARLERSGRLRAIITQNIDGLHTRAGSQNVLEVHGTLNSLTCIDCYRQYKSDGFIEPYIAKGDLPHCPYCGHLLKPDIILFEEQLPLRTWRRAQQEAKSCDLMLVAGTSLEVMPSAGLPMHALENNARLIVVNKSSTYIDVRADVLIIGDVADIIPQITTEVLGERPC
jgi:NAD-dependent deacetylase